MSKANGNENGKYKYVGHPRPIIDGLEKVTGYAQFVADKQLPHMLHGRLVLSPYANAVIEGIDKQAAEAMPGVAAVLTAEDLPTRDRTITSRNSALLAKGRALFVGQPVALVLAESQEIAGDAAELVLVDYDPQPAVALLHEAIKPDAPRVWPHGLPKEGDDLSSLHANVAGGAAEPDASDKPNNTFNEAHYERGDIEAGFAAADVIVERTYTTEMVHQAYLETHAVVADPRPLGRGVDVYTSTQGQHGVRNEVAKLLGLPQSAVTVHPMVFGGGFGAKYGIYEPLTAAAALTVGQAVSLVLSRSEDFLSTTPAPATIIELKTGAKKDGTVTALQARIMIDNGIFSFTHSGIMSLLIGGYYNWPHLKIDAYDINTHKPQAGAYRAPGAPQATFAVESNIDDMARELGLDALDFRLQNAVEGGDPMGTNKPWPQQIGLKKVLMALKEHPAWRDRKSDEGIGIAVGGWPTVMGTAEAVCRVDTDGRVRVNLGIVDVSGTRSAFVLVAAETLGVDPADVEFVQDSTNGAYGPNSGGSQVTYTVAGAVREAAAAAKKRLLQLASDEFEAAEEDIEIVAGRAQVRGVPDRQIDIGTLAQRAQRQKGGPGPVVGEGRSAPPENGPGFVAQLVKVDVDAETGEVTPREYVTIQDVGFALNPLVLGGQLHGGAVQGLGFGLYEAMRYDENGQLLSGSFMDYVMPRINMVPRLQTQLVENASPHGPYGARGIGEPPIVAGPAAVGNAIKDAVNVRVSQLPIQPETVWRLINNAD